MIISKSLLSVHIKQEHIISCDHIYIKFPYLDTVLFPFIDILISVSDNTYICKRRIRTERHAG